MYQGSSKGRPALFQGTSPGVPQLGKATRVVNQTLGFQTNHTINYAYVIRRLRDDSDKSILQGQLVFIKKAHPPLGPTIYTVFNLPLMNNYLLEWALQKYMADSEDPLSVSEIAKEWTPHGVVQGEAGQDGSSGAFRPQERLLNITIAGRARAFNIWGSKATDGTPLYIVLKAVEIDGVTKTDLSNFHKIRAPDGQSLTKRRRGETGKNVWWQFVPYADSEYPVPGTRPNSEPPALFYYVGRVSHNSKYKVNNETHRVVALRDIHRHATLPMLEMFVDYSTPSFF